MPGGLYLILEKFVLRGNTTVMGARYVVFAGRTRAPMLTSSVWVFLLLASEALKTHKANPSFRYTPHGHRATFEDTDGA